PEPTTRRANRQPGGHVGGSSSPSASRTRRRFTMSVKIDPKREHHQLFTAHREPELIVVPELTYLMIDGHGDPNVAAEYRAAIEALYGLSYALKFAIKRTGGPDHTVAPLE